MATAPLTQKHFLNIAGDDAASKTTARTLAVIIRTEPLSRKRKMKNRSQLSVSEHSRDLVAFRYNVWA